jgi:predicted nucleotidyltransferase
MRLSSHDRLAIQRATAEVAGTDARVYLFGSRTRDDLRGGDIDLLVELPAPRSTDERLQVSVRTAARLQRLIGERKIDVLVADPLTPETPLLRAAREQAIAV